VTYGNRNKFKIGKQQQKDMLMTAEEVGNAMGISRQAVSELEHKIFRKLRRALLMKGINKEDILPDD
jgi:DNA-directed RNA polymerase sigma subunit (sigma70/sigma32)